jgi:glutamine synthetase
MLEMADRHTVLKNGIKEIAYLHGKAITFMAKWNYFQSGSDCHIHMSLWDDTNTKALFYEPTSKTLDLSEIGQQFLAGQIKHLREITYFLAPYVNSYKRFINATPVAPTRIVWSSNNRTESCFRLCGKKNNLRIACRTGGADLNPYLAFACLIASGLEGIEKKMKLEPEFKDDSSPIEDTPLLASSLRDALIDLDKSSTIRSALGDDVVDHYLHTGRWEQFEYDRRVTDWEVSRGFERG